jgi:hypothetical protein
MNNGPLKGLFSMLTRKPTEGIMSHGKRGITAQNAFSFMDTALRTRNFIHENSFLNGHENIITIST